MTLTAATITVAVLSSLAALLVLGLMAAELGAKPQLENGYGQGSAGDGRHGAGGATRIFHGETEGLTQRSTGEEGGLP